MSVYKSTSSSTLYSDVKIPSKYRGCSVWGLNPSEANKAQSRTVRDCDKFNVIVNVQNKVSISDICCRFVISKNNIKSSEQKYVGFSRKSRTGVVMVFNNSNVNTSDQDCVDVNRFAVLFVDSSEDEGDSLDHDTVNNPDASYTARGFRVLKVSEFTANYVRNHLVLLKIHLSMCRNDNLLSKVLK